jgi:hypothetical protein
MPLRIEAVEGRRIELCDEKGSFSFPGRTHVLDDDSLYAVGTIDPDGKSAHLFDGVMGYSGPGAHVNGQELEPGEDAEGQNEDLKYLALQAREKELA